MLMEKEVANNQDREKSMAKRKSSFIDRIKAKNPNWKSVVGISADEHAISLSLLVEEVEREFEEEMRLMYADELQLTDN